MKKKLSNRSIFRHQVSFVMRLASVINYDCRFFFSLLTSITKSLKLFGETICSDGKSGRHEFLNKSAF